MLFHMYWNRTEDFVRFAVRRELPQLTGFDALPFGTTVLPPDLHLDLREVESARDLGAFDERQVLLLLEFGFELDELLVGEGRAFATCRRL